MNTSRALPFLLTSLALSVWVEPTAARAESPLPRAFLENHCAECHDAAEKKGGLDFGALSPDLADPAAFARWVKVHDRIESGEMPPRKKSRPKEEEQAPALRGLRDALIAAEQARFAAEGRTGLRRLTRGEYENTVRDLLDLPGLALKGDLPPDGSAHGFDTNADALDLSHVNLARYIEAADRALDAAIATRPRAPTAEVRRISLANPHGFVAHILLNGDAVLLRDKKPDPDFPPADNHNHLDQGAHERMGSFETGASVGLFRHEDESVSPYFNSYVAIYPGFYRVRTSLWSFQWDKGAVLPARGTEAARLSVVQLTGDGRGGQHPSTVLGYFDAPSLREQVHEVTTWLNPRETIGFNVASLAPVANYSRKGRAMAFTGPGIACDWLEIEGPLHTSWPPASHRRLFGDLPLVEFKPEEHPGARPPPRRAVRQELFCGRNRPDEVPGLWTVRSDHPTEDTRRLLADFLPRAFRRPVDEATLSAYVERAEDRRRAGDCFETALRAAYRAALCSPDFLYRLEPHPVLDGPALAGRLSYFLWNSTPDSQLLDPAIRDTLSDPAARRRQAERLLADPRGERFVEDFTGQWLKLRKIAANDPDRKLYPEFSPYLQDSMVLETRAFFRELLRGDLDARNLVRSDFVMVNEKLATHYGIPGVVGSAIRRVPLPPGCPRGGFLTQASVLKITANGTTTSPVPRGAFVMDRLLGEPPEPPPATVPAVEPDVRGATTIREQLAKHRSEPSCAGCHARIDPPGFALESFDVIGGHRERYRSIGNGEAAPRGSIDPFIDIHFRLGPAVDPSGEWRDGRTFSDVRGLQDLLAADPDRLLGNLARQFLVYATGREVAFSDRDAVARIVARTREQGGGVRTLLLEVVQSPLFSIR